MRRNHYCFTWLDVERVPQFSVEEMAYLIFQSEQCPSTGRLHYQGYVEFAKPTRLQRAKTLLGSDSVHLEPRAGTRNQAREYCRKVDSRIDGPWEFGEWKDGNQGRRSDLEKVVDDIKEGKSLKEIAVDNPAAFVRYHKGIETTRALLLNEKRDPNVPVTNVVLWGDSGVGKTRFVATKHEKLYTSYIPGWWQRYDGELVALYDDFDGKAHMDVMFYKRITDRYPVTVPSKNGDKEYRATTNYFTSNVYPLDWYERTHWEAIKRRFSHMIWWRHPDVLTCDICGDDCPFVEEIREQIRVWNTAIPDEQQPLGPV